VLAPKAHAAVWLHDACVAASVSLELFWVCSSVAAPLGAIAQSNYAAANAATDALMARRKRAGLPALSIQWGPWAHFGMAAASASASATASSVVRRRRQVWAPLPAAAALAGLRAALAADEAVVSVARFEWGAMRDSLRGNPWLANFLRDVVPAVSPPPPRNVGDAESSLRDAKSLLGDARARWVTLRARWETLRARGAGAGCAERERSAECVETRARMCGDADGDGGDGTAALRER
jgi:hypothetical protein